MQQPIILDGSRIRSVTAQGIDYLDDEGVEQFIDFAQCYSSYLSHHLTPEWWEMIKRMNNKPDDDWDDYAARVKKFKAVGERNIMDHSFEFYTEPRIRFNFASRHEWSGIDEAIRQVRWRTLDRS